MARARTSRGSQRHVEREVLLGHAGGEALPAGARSHLEAGFQIYYSEDDTSDDVIIKEYPDGRRELVRVDVDGEHFLRALA